MHFAKVLGGSEVGQVGALFGEGGRPGSRLTALDVEPIAHLLRRGGAIGAIAGNLIGTKARPVRAILLDKSPDSNWRLGWHQDRTIAVQQRINVDGFGPWSVKSGQMHVQPPHEVTAGMVTLRVQLMMLTQRTRRWKSFPAHILRADCRATRSTGLQPRCQQCLAELRWATSGPMRLQSFIVQPNKGVPDADASCRWISALSTYLVGCDGLS